MVALELFSFALVRVLVRVQPTYTSCCVLPWSRYTLEFSHVWARVERNESVLAHHYKLMTARVRRGEKGGSRFCVTNKCVTRGRTPYKGCFPARVRMHAVRTCCMARGGRGQECSCTFCVRTYCTAVLSNDCLGSTPPQFRVPVHKPRLPVQCTKFSIR